MTAQVRVYDVELRALRSTAGETEPCRRTTARAEEKGVARVKTAVTSAPALGRPVRRRVRPEAGLGRRPAQGQGAGGNGRGQSRADFPRKGFP